MEEGIEHDWEYIGNHLVKVFAYAYDRYEFQCKRCGLRALCKGKKLNFLQVDYYKLPHNWEKNQIIFVFGEYNARRVVKNYFLGSPKNTLEPACISQDDWDVFDILI
jgi:hypothetical protein